MISYQLQRICFLNILFLLASIPVLNAQQVRVYETSKYLGSRLELVDTLAFGNYQQPLETELAVFVDDSKHYQEMIGIGAAITDATAETFFKVNKESQEALLKLFFDPNRGLGYSIIRTNMNSCDFSSSSYTYVQEGDYALKTFSIAPDQRFKMPLIQQAFAKVPNLKLFVSPWSPPAFMKTNGSMLHGGKLKPEAREAWARYFVRFIKAYEKAGIPVWGLTIQNEPMATQIWESCIYTAEEERDFLKYHLGPTLKKEGLGDKKIIVWDHNRDLLFQRAMTIFGDSLANAYAWGIGYHWYEPWSGGTPMHDNIDLVNDRFPDKPILFTEGCKEKFNWEGRLDWSLGEFYARQMIRDFNSGVSAWTDWNMFLDERGGPNHVGNFCFAPLHVDTRNQELNLTNAYYYIGHFSKFIRPGAKRISCSSSRSALLATAFKNKNGSIALVLMNDSDKDFPCKVFLHGKQLEIALPAHSIKTAVVD
ncbi:MAG: glycosyl hydrolase [Bacteroidia bacterium]|nr:glycosyl hydrolase [Bacteroidia bacterium]